MKNFNQFIKDDLINEGIIEVPEVVLKKAEELYDIIMDNFDALLKHTENTDMDSAFFPDELKNYFKLDDKKGRPLSINVGVYNDPDDHGGAAAGGGEIVFNLPIVKMHSFRIFKRSIEHELVHVMDPYLHKELTKSRLKYDKKYGPDHKKGESESDYKKNMSKYFKTQHEFNAFTTPLITRFRKIANGDDEKIKMIIKMLNIIKSSKDIDDAYEKTPQDIRNLFDKEGEKVYYNLLHYDHEFIRAIGTNQELYRDFIKKIYKELDENKYK